MQFNDLSVLVKIIDTRLALGHHEELKEPENKEYFDSVLTRYTEAIERNQHFIAISPNVESVKELARQLELLFPRDAPLYQVLAARADHHSAVERERIESRPPGYLW